MSDSVGPSHVANQQTNDEASPVERDMAEGPSVAGKGPETARSGLDDLKPRIEQALRAACNFETGCPRRLGDAMRYALLAPGKRLRPALVLMAAETCSGSFDQALPGAVAVEMIHAYSLIHDDLPAMDDDDLRRGRPTVHIEFDEATAILAGDALIALAFSHLIEGVADSGRAAAAAAVLAQAAGPAQLVGGQADDLDAEKQYVPGEDSDQADYPQQLQHLERIHRRKTGALIGASLEIGGILAGAENEQRRVLRNYAGHVGLAFQVVDDLLDFTSDAQALGKRTGKDAQRGKLTYPGLMGVEAARQKARDLIESAQQEIAVFGSAAWRLTWLANYVLERTH